MSDVLVKGMDMPTACQSGKCNFACSAAYQTGLICIVRKQYVVPGDVPVDCPCLLVPLHGRCIDADAFLMLCKDYAITPSDDEFCKRLEYALTKATTIIPAEEGET